MRPEQRGFGWAPVGPVSDPDGWDGAGRAQASLELAPTGEEALPRARGLSRAPALGSPPGISCTGGAAKEPGARCEALVLCGCSPLGSGSGAFRLERQVEGSLSWGFEGLN